jgi:hypothetical protein
MQSPCQRHRDDLYTLVFNILQIHNQKSDILLASVWLIETLPPARAGVILSHIAEHEFALTPDSSFPIARPFS